MVVFPNCKINLGLRILDKRPDGFHNLSTVFYPVPLKESLEIIRSETTDRQVQFSLSGNAIEGPEENNLCIKAYHLLKKDFPALPAIKMHLHKAIPSGAGLGGGSADGAFTLALLNQKFQLHLTQQQLIDYALQLGSDCPFFILNQPCIASGRGELMQPVALSLSGYHLVLVNPGIHINTGWAFTELKKYQPVQMEEGLDAIVTKPVNEWKGLLMNDFEQPVFAHHPEIKAIKEKLYNHGAVYAAMSGSGSTVFGVFNKTFDSIDFPEHYFMKTLSL